MVGKGEVLLVENPLDFCFRARRIDIKNPTHEFLTVKSAYRSERLLLIRHLDKTKPS
jgi:hypothetical protein